VVAVYLLFFLSGTAALIYQVVWVRSLTLVFGGSHQAVTAVLVMFMAGLAVGGYAIGRIADRVRQPLRLYGVLELGIALSAVVFIGLMRVYPPIYVALVHATSESATSLAAIRLLFAAVALIVPTTLMGGTLPLLSRFMSSAPDAFRRSLPLLYGLNTLGAVAGALLAGFLLLPRYPVNAVVGVAVATNVVVGVASLALQRWRWSCDATPAGDLDTSLPRATTGRESLAQRLTLVGIGVSGFCALGYEVLWTRVLTIAVGASVYSFTIMLVAFLTGIALGSKAYGLIARGPLRAGAAIPAVGLFALVQVVIGVTAFAVTVVLRDVPVNAIWLHGLLDAWADTPFGLRAALTFALAFGYMVAPAFFMGVAFPLAADVRAGAHPVGRTVGDVLAYNTIGAILGAAVSGLALIHVFGIERSLALLAVLNVGTGLIVFAGQHHRRFAGAAVATTIAGLIAVAAAPPEMRAWDTKAFAVFRSNQPEAFRTPAMVREAIENTDVLYYAEGIESIVSVIRVSGGEQAFVTNGRIEASTHLPERQCQLTLGHLPMLLARQPRKVLVVGLGSGMTLGATSVHPGVEQLTVAEIEPKVLGVAGAFKHYNHDVLASPKLQIVLNDGRNFLMTTSQTFDVITADPIHPWFRGAGYLYTAEYFALAASRLNPGGVMAQWLPIYELTPDNLRSVVRTFQTSFTHTLLWLTHYDAHLIGSNDPLPIDEAELARRMAAPGVAGDLRAVMMGSPADFLSYFVMGTRGMRDFAATGVLNTDGRLYLEFSAPFSIAAPALMEANVLALTAHRERLLPYLRASDDPAMREAQERRWTAQYEAARVADPALARFLGRKRDHLQFTGGLAALERVFPSYAPGRFLRSEHQALLALEPRALHAERLTFVNEHGAPVIVEITAVLVPVSETRAAVMFVDNRARVVYGQRYVDDYRTSDAVSRLVADVTDTIRAQYGRETDGTKTPPTEASAMPRIQRAIEFTVKDRTVKDR
jgi:spermidine synthase